MWMWKCVTADDIESDILQLTTNLSGSSEHCPGHFIVVSSNQARQALHDLSSLHLLFSGAHPTLTLLDHCHPATPTKFL